MDDHHHHQLSFDRFINTINKEQARDLVRNINVFMKNFRSRPPDPEQDSRLFQEFMASMEVAFTQHPLWAGAGREDLDAAVEGLEKYLTTKLFDRTFGLDEMDRERDAAIASRLQALQFVRPEHLEIPLHLAADSSLLMAVKELSRINLYKSPRDKLVCILSCCKVVNNLLANKKHGAGADDFTPVLIYVTIRAAPDALASNLSYIERYRTASRLVSEAQYFFVQMQSAVAFVETLDVHSSLKVDPDELIAHMLAAGALTDTDLAMMQSRRSTDARLSRPHSQSGPPPPAEAIAQVAAPPHTLGPAGWHPPGAPTAPPPPPPPPPPSQPPPGHNSRSSIPDLLDFSQDDIGMQNPNANRMVDVVDNFQPFANPLWQTPQQQVPNQPAQQINMSGGLISPGAPPPPSIHGGIPPPPPPQSTPPAHSRTASYDVMIQGSPAPLHVLHAPHPMPPPQPFFPPPPPPPAHTGAMQGQINAAGNTSTWSGTSSPGGSYPSNQQDLGFGQVPPPPPLPPAPPTHTTTSSHPTSLITGNQALGGQQAGAPATANTRSASAPQGAGTLLQLFPSFPVLQPVADLEALGVPLILKAHKTGALQARYPLLFAEAGQLSIGQVPQLLQAYKELALKYEGLLLAVTRAYEAQQAALQMPPALLTPHVPATSPAPPPPPPPPLAPPVPQALTPPPQQPAAAAAAPFIPAQAGSVVSTAAAGEVGILTSSKGTGYGDSIRPGLYHDQTQAALPVTSFATPTGAPASKQQQLQQAGKGLHLNNSEAPGDATTAATINGAHQPEPEPTNGSVDTLHTAGVRSVDAAGLAAEMVEAKAGAGVTTPSRGEDGGLVLPAAEASKEVMTADSGSPVAALATLQTQHVQQSLQQQPVDEGFTHPAGGGGGGSNAGTNSAAQAGATGGAEFSNDSKQHADVHVGQNCGMHEGTAEGGTSEQSTAPIAAAQDVSRSAGAADVSGQVDTAQSLDASVQQAATATQSEHEAQQQQQASDQHLQAVSADDDTRPGLMASTAEVLEDGDEGQQQGTAMQQEAKPASSLVERSHPATAPAVEAPGSEPAIAPSGAKQADPMLDSVSGAAPDTLPVAQSTEAASTQSQQEVTQPAAAASSEQAQVDSLLEELLGTDDEAGGDKEQAAIIPVNAASTAGDAAQSDEDMFSGLSVQ